MQNTPNEAERAIIANIQRLHTQAQKKAEESYNRLAECATVVARVAEYLSTYKHLQRHCNSDVKEWIVTYIRIGEVMGTTMFDELPAVKQRRIAVLLGVLPEKETSTTDKTEWVSRADTAESRFLKALNNLQKAAVDVPTEMLKEQGKQLLEMVR